MELVLQWNPNVIITSDQLLQAINNSTKVCIQTPSGRP